MSDQAPEQRVDIRELMQAMEYFNEQSTRLSESYRQLEQEVAKLNLELDAKNRYLTNILESISNGVVGIDNQGCISLVNRAACAMIGVEESHLLGCHFSSIEIFRELAAGSTDPERRDQRNFSQCASLHLPDGRRKVIEFSFSVLEDGRGDILFFRDMTRIIELEQQAQRNEKLAAMGEMAANIAHEIRNPLGSIELFASLLSRDLARDPQRSELAQSIVSGVRSLNSVISNLLLFTRNVQVEKQAIDAESLIGEAIQFCEHLKQRRRISIRTSYAPGSQISGDPDLLSQVVLNLLQNAINAIEDQGEIHIDLDEDDEGEYQVLSLTDTGCGMDEETLRKIFIPFYTTRARGTGLGLAIVNRIVESHGGVINVRSNPGEGTCFQIKLPPLPEVSHV